MFGLSAGQRVRRRQSLAAVIALAVTFGGLVVVAAQPAGAATVNNYTDPGIETPIEIAAGSDGALWFTNYGSDDNGSIGQIGTDGTVSIHNDSLIRRPAAITAGPDGALWFTNTGNDSIGRIDTDGNVSRYFDDDDSTDDPEGITTGSDGALWWTNYGDGSIGRIDPDTLETSSYFIEAGTSRPDGITAGPDGALWVADSAGRIVRIETNGFQEIYDEDNTGTYIGEPVDITTGPDGALWFTDPGNNSIDRITTSGDVTVYTDDEVAFPLGITTGPDGALWFTNQGDGEGVPDSVGRITTSGVVTTYPDDTIASPFGITSGPDGALWFTNIQGDSIGQVTLGGPPPPPSGSAPGAPTITNVTAGDGTATVAFTPGTPGSPHTTGYVASCDPSEDGAVISTSGSGSAIVVSGLANGDDYRCTVFAFNSSGNSPPSAPSDVVTPSHGPSVVAHCTDTSTCTAVVPTKPSVTGPGENIVATGTPSDHIGSVTLSSSFGSLGCTAVGPKSRLIHSLTNRGFSPSTRLAVTATLNITSATSTERVCFNSSIPFFSQAHPTVKQAGTGLLLNCKQVANVAPCVTSSKQVGANIVVKFVVPGGDPRFFIALPKGRQAWLAGSGTASVGKKYSAHVEAAGGRAPFHWKVASGKPPAGLTLNGTTGLISGTPKAKGTDTFGVQATDSAKPAQTAKLSIPITVK